MTIYQPANVSLLAGVIGETFKALEQDGCIIQADDKQAIAHRVRELYDQGVTDPGRLLLKIMADSMWASSQSLGDTIGPTSSEKPSQL